LITAIPLRAQVKKKIAPIAFCDIIKIMLLKLIRKKTRIIMIFAIALIIPAFILWGVPNRAKGEKYAGTISGRKVSWAEYYKSLRACEHQAILTYTLTGTGGNKHQEKRRNLNLEKQAWQRLLLLDKAKKEGIKIEDAEVIAAIKKIPLFQDKEGFFSKQRYKQILNYLGISPREFEEEIRDTLKISNFSLPISD